MTRSSIFCLACILLVADCKTTPTGDPIPFPQPTRRDAQADEFFRHVRYPYVASRERQRLIERAARGMRLDITGAQLLAQLGPPDWKEHVDGYPPKIPPSEIWFHVHTWKRPMGPHYQGKMILFHVRADATQDVGSMQEYGFQKVSR